MRPDDLRFFEISASVFPSRRAIQGEMRGIMTENQAENQLLEKATRGDRAACDDLIGRLQARVAAFVHSRLHANLGERLNVDEIVQDTFVRAYESIGGFRGGDLESFARWLMGVARIAVIKAAGQVGRAELELVDDRVDSEVSPSRMLRREDRFNRLQDSLTSLSDDYREVVYLARIEGLSMKEVAKRMGRSPEAVQKLFGRALRKLRERFGDTESLHLPDRQFRPEGEDHGR